ncbi:hypothetical protein [Sinomonas sp. R1AF57]|uniref:hypothetical protein n=1 Tax=Sinomonas sp. R1AF57 TaxID=2020377 RepID=UPI000B607853|nr:hypothetical protein [Sinomonas sp. R1AF57]ASN52501.1 hypothetical protein CGQ25_10790 [Sinomonas sp. R1AF57]
MSTEVAKARSLVGVAVRRHDPEAEADARAALAAAKIEQFLTHTLAEVRLSPEQLDRIAALLFTEGTRS